MNKKSKPVFVFPASYQRQGVVFVTHTQTVELQINKDVINTLMGLMDGRKTLEWILKSTRSKWRNSDIEALVRDLEKKGLIVDSSTIISSHFQSAMNPSLFARPISENKVWKLVKESQRKIQKKIPGATKFKTSESALGRLLSKRRSVRSFDERSCDSKDIIHMLWSGYGNVYSGQNGPVRKTVPSAGALYPLKIFLVLQKNAGDLLAGIYACTFNGRRSVYLKPISENVPAAVASFVDPVPLTDCIGIVVVAGSFIHSARKYCNRAMPYMLLEAGHVAQNIHLAAKQDGLSTLEIGGFMEMPLGKALGLKNDCVPLITVAFGIESTGKAGDSGKPARICEKITCVRTGWSEPVTSTYTLPFHMSFARVKPRVFKGWSCGRSQNPALAKLKSMVEAKEWTSCSAIPDDLETGRLSDFSRVIDPRSVVSFADFQYGVDGFPFRRFNPAIQYKWATGRLFLENLPIKVLADQVYFPYHSPLSRKNYAQANSSGVAGHTDRDKAVENGVLELIERDSFMLTYLSKAALPSISIRTIPQKLHRRIRELHRIGFHIELKEASLDLAPVILVYAQNDGMTYSTCAACSGFDPEMILEHALMEVEAAIFCRLKFGKHTTIGPMEVKHTSDHGFLYEQEAHYRRASFMGERGRTIRLNMVGEGSPQDFESLLERFHDHNHRLVTIDLKVDERHGGNNGLHFVRSIIPGLVPISFGFNEEPLGMKRVRDLGNKIGSVKYLAKLKPVFPHPYT